MMAALKELHDVEIVHRDVKPESFMVNHDCVKILNFGLTTQFIKEGNHIALANYGFQGTPAFGSISCLEGKNGFRKDDLESLGYSIMYMIDS